MILPRHKVILFLISAWLLFANLIMLSAANISSNSTIINNNTKDQSLLITDSLQSNFGSEYESYLHKAEWSYRFGLFKRAEKFYNKALIVNPSSNYLKYKLEKIHSIGKLNFRNILFFFNIDKPNYLIRILTYLSAYFVVSMFIILIVILLNRKRQEYISKRKQILLEKYQELLVDYLFSSEINGATYLEINKIAASKFNRKILINQMIDLSINLTGNAKDKLRNLFISLELDKDSVRKVYSNKWHVKIKGFRELAFMNIKDANEEIIRCLQSRNNTVRMEAQLAMVRLNPEDSFSFLDQLTKTFTLWEQLTVYETIMFHDLSIPQFDRWLYSKNKSVVIYALRMIEVFKQNETYPNLFWMLVNEDPEIRKITIRVIGNLKIKEALPHLKRLYKSENYENCLTIVQSMSKMPDKSVLNFLKLVLDKEDDVQLQIEAAMAINHMGDTGTKTLHKLMESDYKNYQIIIKHILDKRIN